MTELSELLKLELDLLITMAVGFAAFRIAYAERADPTNTAQTIFLAICFAAIFRLLFSTLMLFQWPEILCIVLAAVATLTISVWWRVNGMDLYGKVWKARKQNHVDGLVSALDTLRLGRSFRPATLIVYTQDGSGLYCSNLKACEGKAFGPCIIGSDGSIAMYATHYKLAGKEDWITCSETEKDQITFIPAGEITLIESRIGN